MKDIIKSIEAGDNSQLEMLYQTYKQEFIEWTLKSYTVNEEIAMDAFQEAVIAFYLNIRKGKIQQLDSSVKTYLFAIGKNKLLNKMRKEQKEMLIEREETWTEADLSDFTIDPFEVNERQDYLIRALQQIGEKCRQLLQLFYFDGNSMEAISIKMGFKNENVAKTQKLRCLNTLKDRMKGK
ncbi:MAG: sigma-70 family RNA polymerase sigma factor [Cyclobacteriaceae bacterium]